MQRAARRANAVAVKKLPENEELLNGEGELLKPSGEEYKEDTSFSGTDSTPGSDHEPNIYFTKFNQRGDLGEQESEELRLEMWRSDIFSNVTPPDAELYKYTEDLNIVGCGTNYVTHSKLACGEKGKKQFTDYFKDSTSIDTDLLKMAKLAVFSGGKPKPEAVAWEAYGKYDDAVTYSKTDQEWEFGKIMTFRTLTFKGGGCMTQWHLRSVLTLQFNFSCIFAFMSTY